MWTSLRILQEVVPGGIVGGGTGGYAGAEASFTGVALAIIAADSLVNPSVMA